jgi:hypothetical protein
MRQGGSGRHVIAPASEVLLNKTILGVSVVAVAAAIGGAAVSQVPPAKAQLPAMHNYVPIGVAASGSTSTAWFHQPTAGTVVACQAASAGAALSGIQCVSSKLP